MDSGLGLQVASGLTSFLLKTTAEWLVCLLLVRAAGSARSRFNLWLTLLIAFVAQWIWTLAVVARTALPAHGTLALAAGAGAAVGKHVAVAAPAVTIVAQAMLVLMAGYLAVLAGRVLGALAARFRLQRAMRYRRAPQAWVAAVFRQAVETAGLRRRSRRCELWVLPGLSSPATLGWLLPLVVIPPASEAQDEAELKAVFWHELKHVERRDSWWNGIVRACRNLLWFHPCVHYAVAALNDQRELACDAAVVREHPHCRDLYASCLVRFARARSLAPKTAAAGIEMASSPALLSARVQLILNEAEAASWTSRVWRSMASVALLGLMVAALPALTLVFAAELHTPRLQLPGMADARTVVRKRMAEPAVRRAERTVSQQMPDETPVPEKATSANLPHDAQLAAEHRAALGVLTESTGMDAPAVGDRELAASDSAGSRTGHPAAGEPSPSWVSVATDAAAHMGPMMGDHDNDRH